MGLLPSVLGTEPGVQPISGGAVVALLRRVVESLPRSRPHRHAVYLGRPDPAAVRAHFDEEADLIRSARRAVVVTPETTLLPPEADRRTPTGWLADLGFTAVLADDMGMAVVTDRSSGPAEHGWLLTDSQSVRRFIACVEGELARPDPQLLAV